MVRAAARVVQCCLEEDAVFDACGADAEVHALLLALVRDERLPTATLTPLLSCVNLLAQHGNAARALLLAVG
jgi:hypothetical protein